MTTFTAVIENGLVRPTAPVVLPEGAVVHCTVAPPPDDDPNDMTPEEIEHYHAIMAVLAERVDTGDPYLSSRVDDHQP